MYRYNLPSLGLRAAVLTLGKLTCSVVGGYEKQVEWLCHRPAHVVV